MRMFDDVLMLLSPSPPSPRALYLRSQVPVDMQPACQTSGVDNQPPQLTVPHV